MTFKIKEHKAETENKTIRFPVELINNIEKQLVGRNITFSSFVIQACRYALDNIDKTDVKKKKNLDELAKN